MGRFILRYGRSPTAPADHVQGILDTHGIQVIDRSPNMLLVDVEEAALRDCLQGMPGWSVNAEQSYPLPDTRHKIG